MFPLLGLYRYWGYLLLAAAFFAGITVSYFAWRAHQRDIGEQVATVRYETVITEQKEVAQRTLAKVTADVRAKEKALTDFKNTQEIKDAKARKIVADLSTRLRDNAGVTGRLRDPQAAGCGGGSDNPDDLNPPNAIARAGNQPETGGLFSAGASQLLSRLTHEADEINLAFGSCKADAISIRQTSNK